MGHPVGAIDHGNTVSFAALGKMAYTFPGNRDGENFMIFLHGSGCDAASWEKARLHMTCLMLNADF